jgi:TDG/mug DNA glycosylase family protein
MNVVLNKRAISPENKIKTNCTPLKSEKKKFKPKLGGFSESQLLKRTLADYLSNNLDLLIIGINPGFTAAYEGHHYAGSYSL